jgi:ATP-dependent DNA helicase RecG
MIDIIGSGIKKMFTIQRDRFFPLPTYDISDKNHTEVTVYGELINENYSRQLKKHPELSLDEVIALDKVQKGLPLNENEMKHLKELKLILGLASNPYIVNKYPDASFNGYKTLILIF